MIFTDPCATAAALKTAGSLARDLGACIRIHAAIAVPYPLPLDQPPVSVAFIERLLTNLVCRLEQKGNFEPTARLYLCRDQSRGPDAGTEAPILGRHRWTEAVVAHARSADWHENFNPKAIALFLSA